MIEKIYSIDKSLSKLTKTQRKLLSKLVKNLRKNIKYAKSEKKNMTTDTK